MPRILLVDDDPDVRRILEHALQNAGYDIDVARNVKGGHEFLGGHRYDLVLTDGWLPDGTGMELADAAEGKGTPALIITGHAFILRELAAARRDKYRVLLKPMRPEEIVVAVADVLGTSQRAVD